MQLKDVQYLLHKVGDTIIPFEISDEAAKGGDATIRYYGWLASNGAWIIQENDTGEGTYRYKGGLGLYAANWAAREGLTYVLFSAVTLGE
jgi:hypothetical protein